MTLLSRPWQANPRASGFLSGPGLEGGLSAGGTRDFLAISKAANTSDPVVCNVVSRVSTSCHRAV